MKKSSEYQVPVGIPEPDCSMKWEKGTGDVISCAQRLEKLQSDHLMVSEILKACERLKSRSMKKIIYYYLKAWIAKMMLLLDMLFIRIILDGSLMCMFFIPWNYKTHGDTNLCTK